jgi:hypothetical protein
MHLCSAAKELVALQMAEANQDMSLNTTCRMLVSAAMRCMNQRKKS